MSAFTFVLALAACITVPLGNCPVAAGVGGAVGEMPTPQVCRTDGRVTVCGPPAQGRCYRILDELRDDDGYTILTLDRPIVGGWDRICMVYPPQRTRVLAPKGHP